MENNRTVDTELLHSQSDVFLRKIDVKKAPTNLLLSCHENCFHVFYTHSVPNFLKAQKFPR